MSVMTLICNIIYHHIKMIKIIPQKIPIPDMINPNLWVDLLLTHVYTVEE